MVSFLAAQWDWRKVWGLVKGRLKIPIGVYWNICCGVCNLFAKYLHFFALFICLPVGSPSDPKASRTRGPNRPFRCLDCRDVMQKKEKSYNGNTCGWTTPNIPDFSALPISSSVRITPKGTDMADLCLFLLFIVCKIPFVALTKQICHSQVDNCVSMSPDYVFPTFVTKPGWRL